MEPKGSAECAAEQRDELASPQLIELRSVPLFSEGRMQDTELVELSQRA